MRGLSKCREELKVTRLKRWTDLQDFKYEKGSKEKKYNEVIQDLEDHFRLSYGEVDESFLD